MAVTQIRGNTQIKALSIEAGQLAADSVTTAKIVDANVTEAKIAADAVSTAKIADGAVSTAKLADDAVIAAKIAETDTFWGALTQLDLQHSGGTRNILLSDPSAAQHAATKAYVDSVASGLDVKESVRVATVAAGTLATDFENGDTVDGVVLATGDRILIKNQVDGTENGIYVVQATGAPVRSTDADNSPGNEVSGGMFTFVEEGTTNADSGFVLTSPNGDATLGVDALVFSQFSGAGSNTATSLGGGIAVYKQTVGTEFQFKSLNSGSIVTVAANGDGNTIDFSIAADSITATEIAASAVTSSELADDAVTTAKILDANVTEAKLATDSVSTLKIVDGAVTSAKIADLTIVDADISATAAITRTKLANGTLDRVIVNNNTTGALSESTITNTLLEGALTGYETGEGAIETRLDALEVSTAASIQESDVIVREVPSGTIDGVNDTFTLASTPLTGKESVYLNGVLMNVGSGNDYTISGGTITFESGQIPSSGDVVLVSYFI